MLALAIAFSTAQMRVQPQKQLLRLEGLHKVVVGTGLKAD